MDSVIVGQLQSFVKISWTPPKSNGSPIIGYHIEIQTSDPLVFTPTIEYCDGMSSEVVALNYCLIPMLTL